MNYLDILKEALEKASAKGLTLNDISHDSGVARWTIRRWETKQRVPSILNFCAVINACGYSAKFNNIKEDLC